MGKSRHLTVKPNAEQISEAGKVNTHLVLSTRNCRFMYGDWAA